jgi:hypothetical protein
MPLPDLYELFRVNLPVNVLAFMNELEEFSQMQIRVAPRTDGEDRMSTNMAAEAAIVVC